MARLTDCWTLPVPLSRRVVDQSWQGTFYILATFDFSWSQVDEEGVEEDDGELSSIELILPRGLLLDESWGRLMLTDVLSTSKVYARDYQFIMDTILSCAHSMARNDPDGHIEVLPMLAFITCRLDDVQELKAPVISGPIWKTYSVKTELKKVKIEGEARTCSICLEDMSSGSVAVSLHCSHVYHDQCVIRWILRSGTCPLCRSASG